MLKWAADLLKLFWDRYPTFQNTAKVHLPPYQLTEKVLYPCIL
jgi:hypothetical protein